MSHLASPRLKFRFDAKVEYVTEELDHNGNLYFMFNIKVVADPEGVDHGMDNIQWSVIKSEDEFHQTHKALKTKYGLLKNFQFRNPSAIGNNMFHLTHPTKPRREKKDDFLVAILGLDPIPDEVSTFLCLDNAFYFAKTTEEHNPHHASNSSSLSIDTSHTQPHKVTRAHSVTAVASPLGAVSSPQRPDRTSGKRWYLDAGLIVSFLVLALGAALLSQLASSVGKATGFSNKDSIVMLLYVAIGQFVHGHLLLWKARGEVLVVLALVYLFAHRVIGWGLGWYLRNKLDPQKTGKFAFHFEWISFRCGLDQNMIVFSGIEWRNPPAFHHTPYLLRIDELSFIIDAESLWRAFCRKGALKVKEIRFNKVTLYMEKLSPKISKHHHSSSKALTSSSSTDSLSDLPDSPTNTTTVPTTNTTTSSATSSTTNTTSTPSATTAVLKPGVLNLWACMGATDAAQEASLLSSVSGQMNSALDSGTSMVSVLGNAVTKYNPAALLYKGGASIGNTGASIVGGIGSAIGKGLFGGHHHHHHHDKHDSKGKEGDTDPEHVQHAQVEVAVDPQAVDLALQDTLHAIGEGEEGEGSGSDSDGEEESEHEVTQIATGTHIANHHPHLAPTSTNNNSNTTSSNNSNANSGANSTATATPASSTNPSPQKSRSSLHLPFHIHSSHHTHTTHTGDSTNPTTTATSSATTNNTTTSTNNSNTNTTSTSTSTKDKEKQSKKGFGLPYLLDIDNLQLDRLELHTQDFLNASHSDVSHGVIKLKSLSMNHKDLSKPPKNDPTITPEENAYYRNKRRPLFLDDVVWRLVNKLLAELLKNNSIAMMVLLSSAAVNNATGIVGSAGSMAYSGAATGGRLLGRASNVVLGSSKSHGAHSTDSTPVRVRPTSTVPAGGPAVR